MRQKTENSRREVDVPRDSAGSALDAVVRAGFELSWGRARDLIRRGKISVDGYPVLDPVTPVRAGARVALDLEARKPRVVAAELPEGALVHVDPHVVVVEKPTGIGTVPFDPEGMAASIGRRTRLADDEVTLDERVRLAVARKERRSGIPPPVGVVHRLDKETSGLIVFTRTWAAKKALMHAFRAHTVHRRYLAIVHGTVKAQTIRTHFVDDRGDGLRGSVEHRAGRKKPVGNEKVQLAITHVEVVERLPGGPHGAALPCTLVECRLETGRTHQIRIHLSELGHPVVGERVYVRGYRGTLVPAPRLMLHAAELGFVHPATDKEVRWTSPLPSDMQQMLDSLR